MERTEVDAGSVVCLCIRRVPPWMEFCRLLHCTSSGMSGEVWLIFMAASAVAVGVVTGGGDEGTDGMAVGASDGVGVVSFTTEPRAQSLLSRTASTSV